MTKYLLPALAVLVGLGVSWGLQALDVAPLWAKLSGLAATLAVLAAVWFRRAAA